MPSLSDVANDIKNLLSDINANTQQTAAIAGNIKNDTADIKTKLDTINNTLNSGFANLALGLFAIFEAEKQTNSLLLINDEENRTIICWLKAIADLLCRELRKTDEEVELQTEIRDAVKMEEKILELVHSRETLEAERLNELDEEIKKCCPPKEEPPEFCYDECKLAETPVYKPQGQDWHPLPGGASNPPK